MSRFLLRENAPLVARNTFGIAARAEMLAEVKGLDGVAELFAMPGLREQPLLVLGEGSNLLFAGDAQGIVVALPQPGIDVLAEDADAVTLQVAAGERWDDLVCWAVSRRLCGLENLAMIPGSVGACPIQNIGAYGTEVGEFITVVEAFDRHTGATAALRQSDCAFGYRDSVFKRNPERWLITAVEFRLPRQREMRLDYPGVREELNRMGAPEHPRPAHVAEAIARIRTNKLPNPALLGNAGSFFKNPVVAPAHAAALGAEFAGLPRFAADQGLSKLSAAWLIEHCGWKGHREGDAGVSAQHALVLVNYGKASGVQILDLARRIAASVQSRFGVRLEPEPRIIGASW